MGVTDVLFASSSSHGNDDDDDDDKDIRDRAVRFFNICLAYVLYLIVSFHLYLSMSNLPRVEFATKLRYAL